MPHSLGIALAASAVLLCTASACAADERLNVVLFLVDDLGWRDLRCYSSPFYETPRIDAFAAQSVRFTQAYAACHVCSPTRASLLTGKYPARLGMTDWLPGRKDFPFQKLLNVRTEPHLPLEEVTLAEVLRRHGYRTAHVGKWHLGEEPFGPLAQGFDVQVPRWNKGWPKTGYHAPFGLDGLADSPGDYLTDRLTDEALRFIEESRDRPFFLYLSHFAVHDPIEGRADLVAKYEAKLRQAPPSAERPSFILEGNPGDDEEPSREELDQLLNDPRYRGFRLLPGRRVKIKERQDNAHFAAMVESVDESLGRILDRLAELGVRERTIVILTSDNGGMSAANFGNPQRVIRPADLDKAFSTSNLPLRGSKGWLYEGGIRVPLVIHWLGHGRPRECDEPVISADLFPSILEMAGIEDGGAAEDAAADRRELDGVSLAPLLAGSTDVDREAIYWHFPHYSNHGLQSPGGAIRSGDYKLIESFENGSVQLFDLRSDPGEQHDLAASEPEVTARLKSMLHAWRERTGAVMPQANPDYTGPGDQYRPR